jgi:hypothetical protein
MRPNARVIFAACLALAAVAASGARPQPAVLSAPAAPSSAAPAPPRPVSSSADASCEATNLAWLVGKPRSAIPVPVYPSQRRVYCSTCMVTQDYIPGRTDIVYDTDTGIITQVKCG